MYSDFVVTKREILISVVILCILLVIGLLISNKIKNNTMIEQQEYEQAVKIDNDCDLFDYGMRTNVGNAFVYGTYKAVDPVGFPEIDGQYSYIKKVKERYTPHTRVVTHTTTVNGKTQTYTTTETYYTWDEIDSEEKQCNKISFLNKIFDYNVISLPFSYHIDTIKESSKIRYVYSGKSLEYNGTIYTSLCDGTMSNCGLYVDKNIEDVLKSLESDTSNIIFWIFWILIMGMSVVGFCYFENNWLNE